jgi:hypothetical protein
MRKKNCFLDNGQVHSDRRLESNSTSISGTFSFHHQGDLLLFYDVDLATKFTQLESFVRMPLLPSFFLSFFLCFSFSSSSISSFSFSLFLVFFFHALTVILIQYLFKIRLLFLIEFFPIEVTVIFKWDLDLNFPFTERKLNLLNVSLVT